MPIQNVVIPTNLGAEFDLGVQVANKISVKVDGTTITKVGGVLQSNGGGISADAGQILTLGTDSKPYFSAADVKANETVTTLTWDALTQIFTYTNEAGVVVNYDLSSLMLDINVTGGSYDPATGVLTLIQDDGGPTITVNLQDLKIVETVNTTTVSLLGTGEAATPLQANVNISAVAGNQVIVNPDGLFVAAVAPFVETPFAATSSDGTLLIAPSGVAGHSPDLRADLTVILPTELVDAFGVHIGQIGL